MVHKGCYSLPAINIKRTRLLLLFLWTPIGLIACTASNPIEIQNPNGECLTVTTCIKIKEFFLPKVVNFRWKMRNVLNRNKNKIFSIFLFFKLWSFFCTQNMINFRWNFTIIQKKNRNFFLSFSFEKTKTALFEGVCVCGGGYVSAYPILDRAIK